MKLPIKERLEGRLVFNGYWCFDPRSGLIGAMVLGTPLFCIALAVVIYDKMT